jgi:hypothetical protein
MKEVLISNSVMIIALSNSRIMRLNLNDPDEIFEIVVWKDLTVKIQRVFLGIDYNNMIMLFCLYFVVKLLLVQAHSVCMNMFSAYYNNVLFIFLY